jgi:2,3-bisphosphoglycerate-dependent phosphoglycerate mutase
MPTEMLAVRHGHNHYTPDEMRPLSEQGFAAAARISGVLAPYAIDAIYASPYTRAWQTVEPLARERGLDIVHIDDLREHEMGDTGALPFATAARRIWAEPAAAFPGGESGQAAQARGVAVVRQLLARHAGGRFVIAGHGRLLGLIYQHFDQRYGYEFWQAMTMPDIHLLRFEGDCLVALERVWRD